MKLNMSGVVINCAGPRELAEFWQQALDMEVAFDSDGDFVALRSRADGARPYLGLQKVPEAKAAGNNRVHVDFATDDMDGEVARLVALGAVRGEKHEAPGFVWTVLRDPEGNEFCVCGEVG